MRIDVITPEELGEAGRTAWRRIQALDPALCDPFHAPEWAEIIGSVRRDARVAVIEDAGQTIGFLAVQKSPPFSMMGLGAPICDSDGLDRQTGRRLRPGRAAQGARDRPGGLRAAAAGLPPLRCHCTGSRGGDDRRPHRLGRLPRGAQGRRLVHPAQSRQEEAQAGARAWRARVSRLHPRPRGAGRPVHLEAGTVRAHPSAQCAGARLVPRGP